MKKYFTKYLPVEGEIKEIKDTWVITPSGLGQFELRSHTTDLQPTSQIVVHTKNGYKSFNELDIKPIKLFLCSRDIQGGDRVADEKGQNYYVDYGNISVIGSKIQGYKVIGEISPDAIWVKEGDEFDENEIQFITLSYTMFSRDEPERISCTEKEWLSTKIEDYCTISKAIEIKCPTCKQFH